VNIVPVDPRIPPSPEAAQAGESFGNAYEAQQNEDVLDSFFKEAPRDVLVTLPPQDLVALIESVHALAVVHRANAKKYPGMWKTWEKQLHESLALAKQMQFEALMAHKKAAEVVSKLRADEFQLCERSARLDSREAILVQREHDLNQLDKGVTKHIEEGLAELKAWSMTSQKEASALLAKDQAAWDKLSSTPIDPDSKPRTETTQLAFEKLKSRYTLELRRDLTTKIEKKVHGAVSRFNTMNMASKDALAKSQKQLAAELSETQTSLFARENQELGYKKAFADFVKTYHDVDRETKLKTMADAAGKDNQSIIRRKLEAQFKIGVANANKKSMAIGLERGEITGTFSVVAKMASHSTNETPKVLENGKRNPGHVATTGYNTGLRLCEFLDLCELASQPADMAPGADFGFFGALLEGLQAGLSET
jgi:hypothetical protein